MAVIQICMGIEILAAILHHFLYRHKRKSSASIEPSIHNALICGVYDKECSLVVTLYYDQAAQDT